jgi:predicted acyl esterase
LNNYVGMKHHAGSEAARRAQRLLVTIGGHAGSERKVGEVDFGATTAFDEDAITLGWYDYLFKNVANDFANPKPVRIFVMGTNQWRDEDDRSRAHTTRGTFFIQVEKRIGNGDGSLTTSASRTEDQTLPIRPCNPGANDWRASLL